MHEVNSSAMKTARENRGANKVSIVYCQTATATNGMHNRNQNIKSNAALAPSRLIGMSGEAVR